MPSALTSVAPCAEFSCEPDCQQQPVTDLSDTKGDLVEAAQPDCVDVANETTTPEVQDTDEPHITLLPYEPRKIIVTGQELPVLTELAISAIMASNNPPRLFVRGRSLVRVVFDERGNVHIEPLNEAAVRGLLSRCSSFIKMTKDYLEIPISVPKEIVQDLMSLPTVPLPALIGVTETPLIDLTTGRITATPGYDSVTQLYYQPPAGFELAAIPDMPTPDEIQEAVNRITEVFCDFPFDSDASRINNIGMLFTVILRPSISGPVPLALINKPQRGTGASLLARGMHVAATGRDASMMTPSTYETEMNKLISSLLMRGQNIIIFDNVVDKLDSPSLASALTSTEWQNRQLGSNHVFTSSTEQVTWFATGNNIQIGEDLSRRCSLIRLNSRIAQPWARPAEEFRHPNLLRWIRDERPRIIAAIFTIARAWVFAGKPMAVTKVPRMGGFENWQDTIGGILAFAGVSGFLENLQEVHDDLDSDTSQAETVIAKMYSLWGSSNVTAAQIADHLSTEEIKLSQLDLDEDRLLDLLPAVLADAWVGRKAFNAVLGRWLGSQKDRVFRNGLTLTKGKLKHNAVTWIVSQIRDEGQCALIPLQEGEVG